MFFDRLKYYYRLEQILDQKNRRWWLFEFLLIIIQTVRFSFYVLLSFMNESFVRSYCPYDTTAAPLFNYFHHLDNGTSLNLTDCCITSIILTIFTIFILHTQHIIFLNDHKSLTWNFLYDISNRNYDHFRRSIYHGKDMNMIQTVIKSLSNEENFDKTISSSLATSSEMMHDSLVRMLNKNHKSFLDKLIIRLMLETNLHKFEKLRLKIFSYAGLNQRIALAMTMFTLHFMDVFLLTFVISTTFTLACLKYFEFIYNHMLDLWPLALFDCIYHLYCGYIALRNALYILHSEYVIFLTDRNSLACRSLYDITIRNYDHFHNSIIRGKNMNIINKAIKTVINNNNESNESISITTKSTKFMHNSLAIMLKKNEKNFLDKLFIRIMLDIDLYKFEKFKLKFFSYTGLKQRIALAITMFILHCMDVLLLTLVISTTFNLACLKYFNFIHIHMWNLWPLALFDCIFNLYCVYIFIRNAVLFFDFASISLIFYVSQMNFLNEKFKQLFVDLSYRKKFSLHCQRLLCWRRFQVVKMFGIMLIVWQ
uniref:Uncharacterized protein LOC113794954 n=1 Tax=Dermatophagoides pteronyssinus TaxID=6956 RepID=A0A6P6Y7D6_DERPT|nr:uncharacterized protein LOC113794954 [Dermatophagoides pteronyssinus]